MSTSLETIVKYAVNAVKGVLTVFWPIKSKEIPGEVWSTAKTAIPAVVEFVQTMIGIDELAGAEKHKAVCDALGSMLDDGFDDLPWWSEFGEESRDKIVGGIVEGIYKAACLADAKPIAIEVPTADERATLVASLRKDGVPLVGLRFARIGARARR